MGMHEKLAQNATNLAFGDAPWGLPPRVIHLCRAMLCISAAYAVMRCLSVCLSVCVSVTFVDHVKTNKDIFEIFSPLGSHTILVFPCQTA